MATCRRLSPSIGIVRSTPIERGRDHRDVLRPGVADQEPRAVGRERDAPRLAADGQPAGDLRVLEIDPDHLVAHAHRHVGRLAVGRERHAPRLGADLDPAGHGDPVVLDRRARPGRSRTSG